MEIKFYWNGSFAGTNHSMTINGKNIRLGGIVSNENDSFQIKFPKGNQTVIQVQIEGFSEDGQLISEFKKIPINSL